MRDKVWVWVGGSVVEADQATVSAVDHGVTVGDGVFETIKVLAATPFALRRHLDRLERSAVGLGLPRPDRSLVTKAVQEVVTASGLTEARLRITVTAGAGPLGSGRDDGPETLVVAVSGLDPVAPTAAVAVVPWVRNERSAVVGLKTTSYAENVVALAFAQQQGASEAVFANTRGELCEGTGSNVFVVVDGELCTPPLSSGCLDGITRQLVLETSSVTVRDLPLEALAAADEAFLTSTLRDVQPLAVVDGRPLAAAPGPRTRAAAEAFAALVTRHLDP